MEQDSQDEIPDYEPPELLRAINKLLKIPRFSTDFSDYYSPDNEKESRYENGLMLLAFTITTFLVLWGFILIFLKCKGSTVGCASGRPFDEKRRKRRRSREEEELHQTSSRTGELSSNAGNQALETSFSSSIYSSENNSFCESTDGIGIDNKPIEDDIDDSSVGGPTKEGPRAERTRLVFLLFAFIVLFSVPMLLSFTFSPLKEAIEATETSILAGRDVIFQVNTSVMTILSATESVKEILVDTPVQFSIYCPNVEEEVAEEELGVDLDALASIVADDYNQLQTSISANLSKIESFLASIETTFDEVETSFHNIDDILWIVPGLLLGVSVLTGYTALGVLLARKKKSGQRFQCILSYVILPIFIIVCCSCWALAVASSIATAISADLCIPGTHSQSPDATVQDLLIEHKIEPNSNTFKFISAYTSGCKEDPTDFLVELEQVTQKNVDMIWRHISSVDSVGRPDLISTCGGHLNDLLSGARNLAKLLTKIRRALDSASDSLECNRVTPLYVEMVHNSICTDVATSTAWGFILFTAVAISMMVMITLRASWLFQFEEEKVYQDEREVAENMIVNEHEEYLHYISKYRHEWQEYSGFDTTSMRHSNSYSDSSGYTSMSASRDSGGTRTAGYSASDDDETDTETEGEENMDTVNETPSLASADISFPSLEVPPSDDFNCQDGGATSALPSLLNPARSTNEEDDMGQDHISFGGKDESAAATTPESRTKIEKATEGEAKETTEGEVSPTTGNSAMDQVDDEGTANASERLLAMAKRQISADNKQDDEEEEEEEEEELDPQGLVGKSVLTNNLFWQDHRENGIEVALSPVSLSSTDLSDLTTTSYQVMGKDEPCQTQKMSSGSKKTKKRPSLDAHDSYPMDRSDTPGYHCQRSSPCTAYGNDSLRIQTARSLPYGSIMLSSVKSTISASSSGSAAFKISKSASLSSVERKIENVPRPHSTRSTPRPPSTPGLKIRKSASMSSAERRIDNTPRPPSTPGLKIRKSASMSSAERQVDNVPRPRSTPGPKIHKSTSTPPAEQQIDISPRPSSTPGLKTDKSVSTSTGQQIDNFPNASSTLKTGKLASTSQGEQHIENLSRSRSIPAPTNPKPMP